MLTFGVLSHTVNSFAKGDLDASFMPDYEDFSLWDDVVHPFFLSIAAYLVSFGPFLLTVVIGAYIVFSNVSSQLDTFRAEVERIPGTDVYAGRELTEQSGDVQEVLKRLREKEARRVAGLSQTAENGTATATVDQESIDQEKLWAEAMDGRKKQLEGAFGRSPETIAMERQAAFQALMKLAAPLVVVGFITLLWGLFFFPAASAVAGYTRSFFSAINPLVGLDTIRRLGIDYVKILMMGLLLMVIAFFVAIVLSMIFAAFALAGMGNLPAQAIGSFISFYFWVVFCCVLGFALFKNSEKLKLLK
jgi:ABC-type multidrug transport system fused ATPase/permease subunit